MIYLFKILYGSINRNIFVFYIFTSINLNNCWTHYKSRLTYIFYWSKIKNFCDMWTLFFSYYFCFVFVSTSILRSDTTIHPMLVFCYKNIKRRTHRYKNLRYFSYTDYKANLLLIMFVDEWLQKLKTQITDIKIPRYFSFTVNKANSITCKVCYWMTTEIYRPYRVDLPGIS